MLRMALLATSACFLIAQEPPSIRVEGRVLGPDGGPRAAMVALVPMGGEPGLSPLPEQRTDAKGHFSLNALTGRYGLTVTAGDCLPHFRTLDLKPDGSMPPMDIRLEKGGFRIQGRLLSTGEQPLQGARVGFIRVSEGAGAQFFAKVTGENFDITLAPGVYQALAEAQGQAGQQPFEVRGGQPNAFIQMRPPPTEHLAWLKGHAIPLQGVGVGQGFADMQPLKALVGDATVVGLGEATHGTREFFQLKHRMLEFLATEMGFTVFAIEANLPEAFAVDDYVLTGRGDPAKALAGLYFWTWKTAEVLDLIRWMRAYNEDPAHLKKLRFYGVDMQTETVAYAQAKAWLERVDPQEVANLISIKAEMAKWPLSHSGKQTEEGFTAWSAIAKDLEALITRLESKKGADGNFDRQRQNLRVLAQWATRQADPVLYEVRDAAMAANLRWIQAREHGAKVVLWAHNMHINLHPTSFGAAHSMGWHLRQSLGKAYLPIGFAFNQGGFQAMSGDPNRRGLTAFEVMPRPQNTLDAALAATGYPVLALDLRARPETGPVKRWLEAPQGTWTIGAGFTPGQESAFTIKEPITEAYDALLFVNRTTRARPMGHPSNPPPKPASSKALVNLGFEEGLKGWVPSRLPYQTSVVEGGAKEGTHCLQMAYQGEPTPNSLGMTNQAVDATSYRSKKVRLRGWIRTDGLATGGYWLRVECASGPGFFESTRLRPVTSKGWTEVTIEGAVAEDAVNLVFGCGIQGMGTAWYDGIRLEVIP